MENSTAAKDLKSALGHLEYSYKKVLKMDITQALDDEEQLETLESFASRFARASDIAISKYFRFLALQRDPGYRGTIIDLLNESEKFGLVESAKIWLRIRELRNVAAHEYQSKDLRAMYIELIKLAPTILTLKEKL